MEDYVISEQFDAKLSLLVDASTPLLQVGILGKNSWKSFHTSKKQALEGLFFAVMQTLEKVDQSLSSVDAIFFCEGPGSTLGLRISCAFVRTLQWANHPTPRFYKYNALDLGKVICGTEASIQAPFRKGFRFVRTGENPIGKKEILSTEDALSRFPESMHLPDPRSLVGDLPETRKIHYSLNEQIRGLEDLLPISKLCEHATPYTPRPAKFKKWQPNSKIS